MFKTAHDPPTPRARWRSRLLVAVAVVSMATLSACSENALGGLGGRSSGWIDEVATTRVETTTTLAASIKPTAAVQWFNDGFEPPSDSDSTVLAEVFARSDGSSQYLQASRPEIVVLAPEVEFPDMVPAAVEYVTSQVVVESRTLRLSDNPTVAFGLWSVEPYTRSRSIGQVAVLTASLDEIAAEVGNDPNSEATCAAFTLADDRLCGVEKLGETTVWRLESAGNVTHLWYRGPYRYELSARSVDEEVIHTIIGEMSPLIDQVGSQTSAETSTSEPSS